jgi:hypothetical protein
MTERRLKEYTVIIGGLPHTLRLDKEAAERYGDAATLNDGRKSGAKAAAPLNKAREADGR